MASTSSRPREKVVTSCGRRIILQAYNYFKKEEEAGRPLSSAEASRVLSWFWLRASKPKLSKPMRTLEVDQLLLSLCGGECWKTKVQNKCCFEKKQVKLLGIHMKAPKNKFVNRKQIKFHKLDSFDLGEIRRIIHNPFIFEK